MQRGFFDRNRFLTESVCPAGGGRVGVCGVPASWVNVAWAKNVPLSSVREGMGHDNEGRHASISPRCRPTESTEPTAEYGKIGRGDFIWKIALTLSERKTNGYKDTSFFS